GAGAEPEHAAPLDEETMRRIPREFNQSETTFVLPPTRPEADWRVRFFTPTGAEVYGAGHNALGAWWWLATAGRASRKRSSARIVTCMQEIGDRVLPVDLEYDSGALVAVGMTQAPLVLGAVQQDRSALAAALRVAEDDFAADRIAPRVVSTGAAHLLVPLRNRAAVARVRPDAEQLVTIVSALGGQGCYVFSLDPI